MGVGVGWLISLVVPQRGFPDSTSYGAAICCTEVFVGFTDV